MRKDLLDWTNHGGHIVDIVVVEVGWFDHMMAEVDMKGSIGIAPHMWIEDWYRFFGVMEGLGNMMRRHLAVGMRTIDYSMNN